MPWEIESRKPLAAAAAAHCFIVLLSLLHGFLRRYKTKEVTAKDGKDFIADEGVLEFAEELGQWVLGRAREIWLLQFIKVGAFHKATNNGLEQGINWLSSIQV